MVRTGVIVLLLIVGLGSSFRSIKHAPLHFDLLHEYQQVAFEEQVFTFRGKDTALTHDVFLLSDTLNAPLLFYSQIHTPVCIDNVCKPMDIKIYWNLIGDYVGFGLVDDRWLTKFDHDLFEPDDYHQLHQLLLDKHSILERRRLSDLFDPNATPERAIEYDGKEVDALSGATIKEIKEMVVEGALYSCYTIWHLVNGEVTQQIKNHLAFIYSPAIRQYFLDSDYEAYQFYVLREMDKALFVDNADNILRIYKTAKPLVRTYLLKKLPSEAWIEEQSSLQLYQHFSQCDMNSKTILLERLHQAHSTAPVILANQVDYMTKNHLTIYLDYLSLDSTELTPLIKTELEKAIATGSNPYTYLITQFLQTQH